MIRTLLLIVILVLVLSFFGISLQDLVNSPAAQANFAYLWHLVQLGWLYTVEAVRTALKNLQAQLPAVNLHH